MGYEVLLVDDSEDMVELMTLYFNSEEDANLTVARNGLEAIEKLNTNKWPDFILLDYNMDKMNGIEFLQKIEKEMPLLFKKTPIVMMSANDPKTIPANKAIELYHKRGDLTQIINIIRKYLPERH